MKAIVEIPDWMLDTTRGLMLMGTASSDGDVKEMDEAIQQLKEAEEPILIDMSSKSKLFDEQTSKQFMLAIASFAIGQALAEKQPAEVHEEKSGLARRLEEMKRQAEEIKKAQRK